MLASLRKKQHTGIRGLPCGETLVYVIIRGRHDQPRDDDADGGARRGADRVRGHDAGCPFVDEREQGGDDGEPDGNARVT